MSTTPYSDQSPDVQPADLPMPMARPIRLAATSGSKLIVGGPCRIMGWAFKEFTGAAVASIDLWDGAFNSGQLIAPITLNQSESIRDWFTPYGIEASQLSFIVNSGQVDGVVYVIPQ